MSEASDAGARPPVGSVHEETARLFAALEGAAAAWSRGGPGDRPGVSDDDDGPAAGHLPTTCGVCPLCLALDRLGRRNPEVLVHLGDAVHALGAAVAALTSQQPEARPDGPPTGARDRERPRSEHIDVTD